MAKSSHTFSKRQREKDKQKKAKEKRERMEERKQEKAELGSSGIEIDWDSAPVNHTLDKEELKEKEAIEEKNRD